MKYRTNGITQRVQNKRIYLLALLAIILLSGCGDGGGDGGSQLANIEPVAKAVASSSVVSPGAEVLLDGSQSKDDDGSIVSYQWKQKDNGASEVELINPNGVFAEFVAPETENQEPLQFELTVEDDAGANSTDTVEVYVPEELFSDSFENDDSWSYEDDTGDGADWSVINNELRQTANLSKSKNRFKGVTTYHLGTYAVLVDPVMSGRSSYHFRADITPLTDSEHSDRQGNDIGIMFRYQNENNYYRVSMSARGGFTRFEKVKNGSFSTLAVNAIGYVDNQTMELAVQVVDDAILIWIDGDPVFAAEDSDLSYGTVALYSQDRVGFDNVLVTDVTSQPVVVIAEPLAYSIASTQENGTLSAEAIALNMPSDGELYFALDGGEEMLGTSSGSIYAIQFNDVSSGEHEIEAIAKDSDGEEIGQDINSTVGTGGDYYVTIGDSITNGAEDTNQWNNDSTDGRIVSIQGFQAKLADNLTRDTGLPQIVFNEGVGGDEASELYYRIGSILERHPGANKILMMIGTNDSGGDGINPNTFESWVRSAAESLNGVYGKQVWIAKPPKTYIKNTWTLDTDRNDMLSQYNQKINEITADSYDDIYLGPSFFQLFDNKSYYADYLHPNDTGYQFMANKWAATLP